ncbi:MAG: hypothetical protein K9N07_00380 [Candidatus Cloacimonetes bacterium]|nr:hypothetical protein [Candidatus Cloacimonadota bacterium]
MFHKYAFLSTVAVLSLLTSCANIDIQAERVPVNIDFIYKIMTNFIPQKCVYSYIGKTAFISEKNTNNIHIFKDGKQINTIGGLGFSATNFTKLTDIALSPDGNLLALDSFQKKIKKFDTRGKFITEFDLKGFIEPILFAVAIDETFYIYDNAAKEIVITRTFEDSDKYTFGKFQLRSPQKIKLGKKQITIYDKFSDSTILFGILGQFQTEEPGNIQWDKQNQYILKDYFIYHPRTNSKFAINQYKWKDMTIDDFVILISDQETWIGKIGYSNVTE